MSNAAFDEILNALQGETVLVKPRVSRETIIDVLKEHTELLRSLRHEMDSAKETMQNLVETSHLHSSQIKGLLNDTNQNKSDIVSLKASTEAFNDELNRIKETLGEISTIKKEMKYQKACLEDISFKMIADKAEMKEQFEGVDRSLAAMDSMNKETQFLLKELKEYVDHFGDNLILASTQITVESKVGFADRPLSLQDVLKMVNKNITTMGGTLKEHTSQITESSEIISTKADATVGMLVESLDHKIAAIEHHLKQEEEHGALRKMCQDLSIGVEHIMTDLSEKVDRKSVELIVHNKYEDIVEYLQQALHSGDENEDEAKHKSQEVQEQIKKLAASKADKLEIMSIQEALVKAEALFQKVAKNSEAPKVGMLTKDQIEELLNNKVDKVEFNEQIQSLLKGIKKNKKNAIMNGGMAQYEESPIMRSSSQQIIGSSGAKPAMLPRIPGAAASNLGSNMMPNYNNNNNNNNRVLGGGQFPVGGVNNHNLLASYPGANPGESNISYGAFPDPKQLNIRPNVSTTESLSILDNQNSLQQNSIRNSSNVHTDESYRINESGFENDINNNQRITSGLPSYSNSNETYSFNGNIQSGVPTPIDPDAIEFRPEDTHIYDDGIALSHQQTTVMDGGGWNLQSSYPSIPPPIQTEKRATSPAKKESMFPTEMTSGGHGQDLSVLGASTLGGGFNTKKDMKGNHLVKQGPGLKALGDVQLDGPDLEGLGMMVKGSDGKNYYSDTFA